MKGRHINWPETAAALTVLAFGVFMAAKGMDYPLGSLRRMGAGFMPVALGTLLALFGVGLLFEALRAPEEVFEIRLRPLIAIGLSILFFAFTVRHIGMIPATLGMIVLAAFADPPFRAMPALLSAAVIAIAGYLLFVPGLGVSLDPFWW
ncbi:tripartite tricarboxylate transporter TctB family protein [Chelativorans sp. YIM 93263]|uniref:tripartite tricarboxylate transporter TctB family protein n=1 Tax=Chelativorans sp. YIM 93263 TaxID=2906648 RepID=UPI002378A8EC|nr:tripartite tricarboxylate transporter TctB family protein [Chelativorans sp. YIM 93263]